MESERTRGAETTPEIVFNKEVDMKYVSQIQAVSQDPAALEELYRQSMQQHSGKEFTADLLSCRAEAPQNQLLNFWYFRLQESPHAQPSINWALTGGLAGLSGLLCGLLAASNAIYIDRVPYLVLVAPAIIGSAIIAYLALASRRGGRFALILGAVLWVSVVYTLLLTTGMAPAMRSQAMIQLVIHNCLLVWAGVGLFVVLNSHPGSLLALQHSGPARFAFLYKSLEVFTIAGLSAIAASAFFAVSLVLFETLNVKISMEVQNFVAAGIGGMIPVFAVAWMYNPQAAPEEQDFQQGVSRILATLLQVLVFPTLLVAVIYVALIPFNFYAPFSNRDVLIAYNVMLFAVMALLLGATPLRLEDLAPRGRWMLQKAFLVLTCLAVLVSVYALTAILSRTQLSGGLTVNRLVMIGWNLINTFLLSWMIYTQIRPGQSAWNEALKRSFAIASNLYVGWGMLVILLIPLLFR